MATKRYNQENFYIEMPDGRTLGFYCWTTNTRNGFCHTCWCVDTDQTTKCGYFNRTWENYDYQTVLQLAFKKLHKADREVCNLWDVAKVNKGRLDCEAFVNAFKAVYDKTPQELKDKIAESGFVITNTEQAESLMGLMKLATMFKETEA